MPHMSSSKLRHYITIQAPTYEQNEQNGAMEITGWTTFAQVWAAIEPLSGRDLIAAQAQQSKITGRITIRWREGLSPEQRISYKGQIYSIEAILPDPDSGREWVTLPVSAGTREQ